MKTSDTGRDARTFEGIEFVWIPPGNFTMGSPSNEAGREKNETQHEVMISQGFWLGKYEVTQAQWQQIMGNNPSHSKGEDRPVENVSWNDIQVFMSKLNEGRNELYRLPTEAEWEYACRAGSTHAYTYGDGTESLSEYGWYSDNSGNQTHEVGRKKPNAWGLYDMHGNVWEWCQDWYRHYSPDHVTDPTGSKSGRKHCRVLRGGSWGFHAVYCRAAYRRYDSPDGRGHCYGFRVARS